MTASVKKEHEYGWPEQQEWILKILNQKFQEQEIAIQNMLNIALDWEELSRETPRQTLGTSATMTNEAIVSSTQLLLGKSLEAVADEPIDGDQSEAKMTTTSTRKGIASLGKAVEREVSQPAPPIRKFVEGPLDAWMGLIVCILAAKKLKHKLKTTTFFKTFILFHALSLLRGEETRFVFRCLVSTPTMVTTCVEVYTLDS